MTLVPVKIMPAINAHTSATAVHTLLLTIAAQNTTTIKVFEYEVCAKDSAGLDAEFGKPGQVNYNSDKIFYKHCVQAAQAARTTSGTLYLVEARQHVGAPGDNWHAYGVFYKNNNFFIYDPDYIPVAPGQAPLRITQISMCNHMRTAFRDRPGGARVINHIWISGGGNVGQLNCRRHVQAWIEEIVGIGVTSTVGNFENDPAAAGWVEVTL